MTTSSSQVIPVRFLLTTLLQFCSTLIFSQIFFENPSFENGGAYCNSPNPPIGWSHCEGGVANCKIDTIPGAIPDTVVDGRFQVSLALAVNGWNFGSIGQHLNCLLLIGKQYQFSFYACTYHDWDYWTYYYPGKLAVFLGPDTCLQQQRIYQTGDLDSAWELHRVRFIPGSQVDWMIFGVDVSLSPVVDTQYVAMMDTLSPIYPINGFDVEQQQADTTVLRATPCVPLSAQPLVSSFDTVYWVALHANGTTDTLGLGQWQIAPCPDSTTTYIVAMHDSTLTCAGTWWSFDTVVITVVDSLTALQEPSAPAPPLLYPNPARQSCTLHTAAAGTVLLHNALGQLLLQQAVPAGRSSLPLQGLPAGLYTLTFTPAQGPAWRGRLVVQ